MDTKLGSGKPLEIKKPQLKEIPDDVFKNYNPFGFIGTVKEDRKDSSKAKGQVTASREVKKETAAPRPLKTVQKPHAAPKTTTAPSKRPPYRDNKYKKSKFSDSDSDD